MAHAIRHEATCETRPAVPRAKALRPVPAAAVPASKVPPDQRVTRQMPARRTRSQVSGVRPSRQGAREVFTEEVACDLSKDPRHDD
jgi:hypothetical protein